ncbi:MAG: mercury(II) reductase [Candidatus Thermoplasmatota archaeon]|nr:mercury(II) reductase [Candidatus Thermoplasmatota archaeon]
MSIDKPEEFDLIILGRGAAAFSAAIKASELTSGQATIAMTGTGPLGGTCVNVGCVPSKYLVEAAKSKIEGERQTYPGIIRGKGSLKFDELMGSLRSAVESERTEKYENVIRNYPNIKVFDGRASFTDPFTVEIINGNGRESIRGFNFLLATGSSPVVPDIPGLADAGFLTSNNIWEINRIPGRLAIIGGGFIALELGQSLQRLGSHVTIIKEHSSISKVMDPEFQMAMINTLQEEGVEFLTGVSVLSVKRTATGKVLTFASGDRKIEREFDEILISRGRKPNVAGLNLEKAGVEFSERGVRTDPYMRTSNERIYAAGDVVDQRYQLETLAAREGSIAVSNIYSPEKMKIELNLIPWAIFTEPQYASVGLTEKMANDMGINCTCRTLKIEDVPKGRILHSHNGLFRIIADPENGKVLGIEILAPYAAEMIMEGVHLIRNGSNLQDLVQTTHVFPTVAEGIKLTAQSFFRDMSKMSCCME